MGRKNTPRRQVSGSKVRGGLAMAMRGSLHIQGGMAGATIKINDDGFYNLIIGAADMGTGCDTTLAQGGCRVPGLRAGRYRGIWG